MNADSAFDRIDPPQIIVEFFGIPRLRMGGAKLELEAGSLDDLLQQLAILSPSFEQGCLSQGQLAPEFLVSINGRQFTRDNNTPLRAGDQVLILSADVGG